MIMNVWCGRVHDSLFSRKVIIMLQRVEMTVLIDNTAPEPFTSEWGLSILITADHNKILLDTGAGKLFSENAEKLGINLSDVDRGVLSHAHYDHADGMDAFFATNGKASFYVREGSCENCYGIDNGEMNYIGIHRGFLDAYAVRIHYAKGLYKIEDGIWLVPHRKLDYSAIALRNNLYALHNENYCPDDFSHEQSLVIESEKGLIVFNSCSHAGMLNILGDIQEMLGRNDVFAYVGGLHLYNMTDDELSLICADIQDTGIEHIITGHCTGDHAFEYMKSRLGSRIERFSSGFTISF